jgi:hypothetical protein
MVRPGIRSVEDRGDMLPTIDRRLDSRLHSKRTHVRFNLLDTVVLDQDVPERGLRAVADRDLIAV